MECWGKTFVREKEGTLGKDVVRETDGTLGRIL